MHVETPGEFRQADDRLASHIAETLRALSEEQSAARERTQQRVQELLRDAGREAERIHSAAVTRSEQVVATSMEILDGQSQVLDQLQSTLSDFQAGIEALREEITSQRIRLAELHRPESEMLSNVKIRRVDAAPDQQPEASSER